MRCIECGAAAVTERPERTAQGCRRFPCRQCGKRFNARSGTPLNRAQLLGGSGRAVQRASRHGGRQGILPVSQGRHGHHSCPGHDGRPRQLPACGLDRAWQGCASSDQLLHENGLEQDRRGNKGRYRPMRGFKCPRSAARFCRGYDELRHFPRLRSSLNQHVPAASRTTEQFQRPAWMASKLALPSQFAPTVLVIPRGKSRKPGLRLAKRPLIGARSAAYPGAAS